MIMRYQSAEGGERGCMIMRYQSAEGGERYMVSSEWLLRTMGGFQIILLGLVYKTFY